MLVFGCFLCQLEAVLVVSVVVFAVVVPKVVVVVSPLGMCSCSTYSGKTESLVSGQLCKLL